MSPVLGSDRELDDNTRFVFRRGVNRVGAEGIARAIAEARAALMDDDIARADRAAGKCPFRPCRSVVRRLVRLARKGQQVEAVNALLRVGLFVYENSIDHLRAYLEYEKQLTAPQQPSRKTHKPRTKRR